MLPRFSAEPLQLKFSSLGTRTRLRRSNFGASRRDQPRKSGDQGTARDACASTIDLVPASAGFSQLNLARQMIDDVKNICP